MLTMINVQVGQTISGQAGTTVRVLPSFGQIIYGNVGTALRGIALNAGQRLQESGLDICTAIEQRTSMLYYVTAVR